MIFETFARRKERAQRGEPEVFSYDTVCPQLRHQICMALHEGIGTYHVYQSYNFHSVECANQYWEEIDRICTKEIHEYLQYLRFDDLAQRFFEFLSKTDNVDNFLSGVEIACQALSVVDSGRASLRGAKQSGASSIDEINGRFLQHGVGYCYENRQIIRVDSAFVHAEVIKPALKLVSQKIFAEVSREFMAAHAHYRSGALKDSVTAAHRAFESMLKIICDARGWSYSKGARASGLIATLNSKGFFTHRFDKTFDTFAAMLKSGLPTIRNDAGAHGDGAAAFAVTSEVARLAINTTAANIVFLAEIAKHRD